MTQTLLLGDTSWSPPIRVRTTFPCRVEYEQAHPGTECQVMDSDLRERLARIRQQCEAALARLSEDILQREAAAPTNAAKIASKLVLTIQQDVRQGHRAKAVDALYDELDQQLIRRQFESASVIMSAMIQNELPLFILVSALTVTLPWRSNLDASRAELVNHVRTRAISEGGPAKAEAVLRGLT